ncbi:hypothetical protein OVA19_00280 [Streptomyces sp. SL203]|nr:hypothetical protein [Streptomyces sp. SL203]MCY1649259.1 hypothetical protein [Streptomyces sp. SL203]
MTSTNALPMPVAEALANGAPRNLGTLAATATARGWGAMVERDGDAWTLVIATPSDSRTGRYTWVGGKWGKNTHGYRATVAFYESGREAGARRRRSFRRSSGPGGRRRGARGGGGGEAFRIKATLAHDRVAKRS